MKSNFETLLLAITGISIPVIAIVLLTFLVWAATGLSFGQSLLAAGVVSVGGAIALYRKLLSEVKEFNIEIDIEDDEIL